MTESPAILADDRPVLAVTDSACGRAWTERLDGASAMIATAIAQTHGVPDLVARVLAGRGVSVQATPGFLRPRLRDLMPDPSVLAGMDDAAARLADAVARGERVAVFGDYDVDGACSAALLAGYLETCGLRVVVHIPDRMTEGYGPNAAAMARFVAEGASLVVTVDCGTAGHEPLAEAARLGADVIVLDHHGAPEELPPARAIVNPNRQDDLSGLGHLCAAGIVFMTLGALARELRRRGFFADRPEPDLLASLDLVALATVADVVPLRGLNRGFVRQGLAVMRGRRRLGLAALIDAARVESAPECWHLGFCLGPRINAGGRIGDSSLGAKLLMTQDPATAATIAATLERLNEERRAIEARAVEEAEAEADLLVTARPELPVLILSSPDWHPGIVGLVAARLKERFGRPAFAFARRPDGTLTGSGRSVAGADLGRAVRVAVEARAALKGGGHAMAAGATLADTAALDGFRAAIEAALPARSGAEPAEPLTIDAVLSAGGASVEAVRALEEAGPFGSGQPEPVFAFARHRVAEAREVGAGHVRVVLKSPDGSSLRAIAFRSAEKPLGRLLLGSAGEALHVAGSLALDRWGGGERVELRLFDAARPDG